MSDVQLSEDLRAERVNRFEELYAAYLESVEDRKVPIEITLPDGAVVPGVAFETTPNDVASSISGGLARSSVVAKIDNSTLWDMGRPLEASCGIVFLRWDDEEAQEVYWHSSSHVLGESLEHLRGVLLCNGPPVEQGFYYDSYLGSGGDPLRESDLESVTRECQRIIRSKQPFVRVPVAKSVALELFSYNKFKCENIEEKVPEGGYCTVYRCGDLIDPCTGPHVLHTGRITALLATKPSSAFWRADENREIVQRVYGISFPKKPLLKAWVERQEELKKRSHKFIGQQQDLWFTDPVAPGMVFFAPKGARVYNVLQTFMRQEQRKRGFVEVHTPNMFHSNLFVQSGHWANYSDDMFKLTVDNCDHALKPMNCPGHCIVFGHRSRNYKELPLRMAEYGVLHRNERRGALHGMSRVRRFVQDDAHIFIRADQIQSEIGECLEFMNFIYGIFAFEYRLKLSTRPEEKFVGEIETWDHAEEQLRLALEAYGKPFEVDEGGGAFYGPKIDIYVCDSLERWHQTATVQLDFCLPERFNLRFTNADNRLEQPVMVHRAIYGSFERFLSVVTEHCAGKWPFWMSPRQIAILPMGRRFNDRALELKDIFFRAGYEVDVDLTSKKVNRKVAVAQSAGWNLMLVVGRQEVEDGSVNVRLRDLRQPLGSKSVEDVLEFCEKLVSLKPFPDPQSMEFDAVVEEETNDDVVVVEIVEVEEEAQE